MHMKNSIKKIFSLLFCILICITSISFAFAEPDTEIEREKIEEDFDIINTVLNSDSYTFNSYISVSSAVSFTIKVEVIKKAGQKSYLPGSVTIKVPIEKTLRELHCYTAYPYNPLIKVVCPLIDGFSTFKTTSSGVYEAFNTTKIEPEDTFRFDGEFQVTLSGSSGAIMLINNKTVDFSAYINNEYAEPVHFITDVPFANFTKTFSFIKPLYDLANGTDRKVGLLCNAYSNDTDKNVYRDIFVKFTIPADSELITDIEPNAQGYYPFSATSNHDFYAELKLGSSFSDTTTFWVNAIFYARKCNCNSNVPCEHDDEDLEEIYNQTLSGSLQAYTVTLPEYSFTTTSQGIDLNELASMDEANISYSSGLTLPISATGNNAVVRYKFAGLATPRQKNTAKKMLQDNEYEVKGVAYYLRDMNDDVYPYEDTVPMVHIRKAGSANWELFTPEIQFYANRTNKDIRLYRAVGVEYFIEFPDNTVEYYLDFPGITNGIKESSLLTSVSLKLGAWCYLTGYSDIQEISGIFGIDVITSGEHSVFLNKPVALNYFSDLQQTHNLGSIENDSPAALNYTKFYSVCSDVMRSVTYTPMLTANSNRTYNNNTQKYIVTISGYLNFLYPSPIFTSGAEVILEMPDGFKFESASAPNFISAEEMVIGGKNAVFITLGEDELETGTGYAKGSNFAIRLITTKEPTEYSGNYSFSLTVSDFTPPNYYFDTYSLTKNINMTFTPPASSKQAMSLFRKTSDTEYTLNSTDISIVSSDLEYSYKLKFYAVSNTHNLILYDNLDNSKEAQELPHWSGAFEGIDVTNITEQGFNARIHYSHSPNADILERDATWNIYTEDTPKSEVKSIAIEILNMQNEPAEIDAGTSLFVEINMKAPENYPNSDLAYNSFISTLYTEENLNEMKEFSSNLMKTGINEPYNCILTVNVTDENNVPLPNSNFGIYNENNILLYTFTSEESAYLNENIPTGNYVIKQISPPEGYQSAEDKEFELTEENNTIEITLINNLLSEPGGDTEPDPETVHLPDTGAYSLVILMIISIILAGIILKIKYKACLS